MISHTNFFSKLVWLGVLTPFLFSAGCVKKSDVAEKHEILVINNFNEPESLDPSIISGFYENAIVVNLFEGLVGYDPKGGNSLPAGATHWDISADQKTYTFHLRRDAHWSDGRPVTASDYIYAWERALNPKTGSAYAFVLYYIQNGEAYNTGKIKDPKKLGMRAIDPYTLQMTLTKPTPFILSLMPITPFSPLPRWTIEKFGTRWTQPENMVTNGPFKLTRWLPNKEILMEKSDTYWDRNHVRLAGARFLPIEDRETALRMYDNNQIDVNFHLPEKKIPFIKNRPDMMTSPWFSSYFYTINTRKAPLNNLKVRQALTMAIDIETLGKKYLQSVKTHSRYIVPPGIPGYTPAQGLEFNPKRARELLAEAGYSDPSKFPRLSIKYNTDALNQLIAQVIQQMWKEHLGISVDLINEEWKTYASSRDHGNYDICRFSWAGDYLDPNTFLDIFLSQSSYNSTGWGSSRYDQLLEQANSEPNEAKRLDLLRQAETLLVNQGPVIPLYIETKHTLIRPYVKGIYPNLLALHPLKEVTLDFEN